MSVLSCLQKNQSRSYLNHLVLKTENTPKFAFWLVSTPASYHPAADATLGLVSSFHPCLRFRDRYSAVSIVITLRLDGLGFVVWFLVGPRTSRSTWWPTKPLVQGTPGPNFVRINRQRRKSSKSHPSNAEIKSVCGSRSSFCHTPSWHAHWKLGIYFFSLFPFNQIQITYFKGDENLCT
jgi:hypothetical protein